MKHRKTSLSPVAAADLARAEAALQRREARFHSVRSCLRWAFRASANLSEPLPDLVRRTARSGEQIRVDGGGGSTIEDVLCDLATVAQALSMLESADGGEQLVELVRMAYQEGLSQSEIDRRTGLGQQWVSRQLDRAEWYMAGLLMQANLVAQVKPRQAVAAAS